MKELAELIEYYLHNENLTNKVVDNFLEETKTRKVCIFGAGEFGKNTASLLNTVGIKVDFFCDNDTSKCNDEFIFRNIPCYNYEKLKALRDETVVLIGTGKTLEIAKQLDIDAIHYYLPMERKLLYREFWHKNSLSDFQDEIIKSSDLFEDELSRKIYVKCFSSWFSGKFESFSDVCSPDQYFLKEIYSPPHSNNETFVDVGSSDGDTIQKFLEVTNNVFDRIYAFEFGKEAFQKLENYVNTLPAYVSNKIQIYNVGLGEKHESIRYYPQGKSTFVSNEVSEGSDEAKLVPLDDIVDGKITFIKMDVEGSELSALKGAKKIIQTHKPKLAICVYHKLQDLWEIPLYIKKLNQDYKLFLRHHTVLEFETVCYAV